MKFREAVTNVTQKLGNTYSNTLKWLDLKNLFSYIEIVVNTKEADALIELAK